MIKLLLFFALLYSASANAQEHLYDYTLFTNSRMPGNYFFSKISFQSPSFIKNINYRLAVNEKLSNTPGNSLELQYVNGKNGNWKANIFREDIRGQDHFKPAKFLSFSIYCTILGLQEELPQAHLIFNDSSLSQKINFCN